MAFEIGALVTQTFTNQRTDGLKEREKLLMRIVYNDGFRCEWETMKVLEAENVLMETTRGGFVIRFASMMKIEQVL